MSFIDLLVRGIDEKTLYVSEQLGYRALGILNCSFKVKRVNRILIFRTMLFSEEKEGELRRKLHGIKKNAVIVFVKPLSVSVARFAGRDSRVDGVVLTPDSVQYIDRAQINLMKQFSKPLILPFKEFINTTSRRRSMIYRRIVYAYNRMVDIIPVSSSENPYDMLVPVSMAKFFESMFSIPSEYWIHALSSLATEILVKNGVKP